MYLLGLKNTSVSDGKNEKGYSHPINIVKASIKKEDMFDGIKQLVQNGYKINDIIMLQEIPFGVDILVS